MLLRASHCAHPTFFRIKQKFNNAGLCAKKKVGAWPIQSAGEDGGE
jgi:hypothetical protein